MSATERPRHPFWCDECGGKSPFTIRGCPITHANDCPHHPDTDEKAESRYTAAVAWLKANSGSVIP